MYVCMYVCMKPNFVPVITLERMEGITQLSRASQVCLNLELIEFWSQIDDLQFLFKKKITILQIFLQNSILCTKGAKWAFLNRVWSLQYELKASKHEPKASAFCEPKTSTATTRGQKAHLALGAHHIFCNTSIVFRVFFYKKRSLWAAGKKSFFVIVLVKYILYTLLCRRKAVTLRLL